MQEANLPPNRLDDDMEIRQITADERAGLMLPLQAYAFEPSPWPDDLQERYRRRSQYFTTTTSLVAEEGGQALACVGGLPMRQNVRGSVYDMAGVASVAAHPAARRRGFVRDLMTHLLRQSQDQGCALSALYPFRPSFYARFGYVGIPRVRKATFAPQGLSHLIRAELPGEVERMTMRDGFDEFDALTRRLLVERHGFAVFDEVRNGEFREDKVWVAIARVDREVVGAVRYRVDQFGGDLVGEDLLTTGPLGRALLLQYFARHVDQAARVVVKVGTDEVPDLWGTDMAVVTAGTVEFPRQGGPMVRILDVEALEGLTVGDGAVTVEVVDDPLVQGVYRLEGDGGKLSVTKGDAPAATLTVGGLSGLVYGVLDPLDVVARGLGKVGAEAVAPLRSLFPREMPYIFADF
jgi:predicted N-acetyltransferase YhbS